MTLESLFAHLPETSPAYLYDLVGSYPSRPGKGLRAALCLATCGALGGNVARAVNSAAAIELFHNAFLIHDDIQDDSEQRRGAPALPIQYGIGVALNVGNATNLIALQRLMANRGVVGARVAWQIFQETELMFRHTLEGQAIEIGWIRDNACDLAESDYLRMCLKKTSWYTCIYPCRVGALIARHGTGDACWLDRYAWYLGAAFQIRDDVLNLVGDFAQYGKEISGDLYEGKRTLMIIHLLQHCADGERAEVERYLALSRRERDADAVQWIQERLVAAGSIEAAVRRAGALADAAREEALAALSTTADSEDKRFLMELPSYVVGRRT